MDFPMKGSQRTISLAAIFFRGSQRTCVVRGEMKPGQWGVAVPEFMMVNDG